MEEWRALWNIRTTVELFVPGWRARTGPITRLQDQIGLPVYDKMSCPGQFRHTMGETKCLVLGVYEIRSVTPWKLHYLLAAAKKRGEINFGSLIDEAQQKLRDALGGWDWDELDMDEEDEKTVKEREKATKARHRAEARRKAEADAQREAVEADAQRVRAAAALRYEMSDGLFSEVDPKRLKVALENAEKAGVDALLIEKAVKKQGEVTVLMKAREEAAEQATDTLRRALSGGLSVDPIKLRDAIADARLKGASSTLIAEAEEKLREIEKKVEFDLALSSLPADIAKLLSEFGLDDRKAAAGRCVTTTPTHTVSPHLTRSRSRWCGENGATSLADLGAGSGEFHFPFVDRFVSALGPLPPITKAKLADRIKRAAGTVARGGWGRLKVGGGVGFHAEV